MSLILGLDFETSGLDPVNDRVLEVGLALWDTERHKPISQQDFYVKPEIEIPDHKWEEIAPITGIVKADIDLYGIPDRKGFNLIQGFMSKAKAIVAHNGTMFDKLFYEAWESRYRVVPMNPLWIDTRLDTPEPMVGKLICLAAQKGFLNPFPHQALSDVLTMLRILDGYDFDTVIERAKIPNITVCMSVPFADKDYAKKLGYYWRPEGKMWLKVIKACDLYKEQKASRFWVMEVTNVAPTASNR